MNNILIHGSSLELVGEIDEGVDEAKLLSVSSICCKKLMIPNNEMSGGIKLANVQLVNLRWTSRPNFKVEVKLQSYTIAMF